MSVLAIVLVSVAEPIKRVPVVGHARSVRA